MPTRVAPPLWQGARVFTTGARQASAYVTAPGDSPAPMGRHRLPPVWNDGQLTEEKVGAVPLLQRLR